MPLALSSSTLFEEKFRHSGLVQHGRFASATVLSMRAVAMDLSFEMASVGKESCDASQRSPDKLWEQILGRMLRSLLGDATGEENAMREDEEALASASDIMGVRNLSVPQLGCVAFVAGHLALRMLVFLEGMHSALKKQADLAHLYDCLRVMPRVGQEEREAEVLQPKALLFRASNALKTEACIFFPLQGRIFVPGGKENW
ncbi:unnamed protein product [Polarella glacialis]|uniref:Uncharacterized protein n=1 Tax=Polarella glacialis TaxID=89957 RepID=A0A813HAU3_POLGL|nr:unnamed protein product [Polarella glacialis]